MISEKTQLSARLWCREHTGDVENSLGLIIKFLESCNDDQRGEWLYRGWRAIWDRIQDNLNVVPFCNERRKPPEAYDSNEDDDNDNANDDDE